MKLQAHGFTCLQSLYSYKIRVNTNLVQTQEYDGIQMWVIRSFGVTGWKREPSQYFQWNEEDVPPWLQML